MNFRAIKLASVLLASPLVLAPLAAEEAITTMSSEDSKDGMVTRSVHFVGAWGEECLLASITCGGSPRLDVELTDIPAEEAAKSVAQEQGGRYQTNPNESQTCRIRSASGGAELTPFGESSGAAGFEIVPAGQAAILVEVVVD